MLPNPVDIYYNAYATQLFDELSGAERIFSFLSQLYADETPAPWDEWFESKNEDLHLVIQQLQKSPSYSVYVEHLFAGMPYWNAANLTSAVHISSLSTMHRDVNETTWHGLGQRDNGQTLKTIADAVTKEMGRDFMTAAMRASPHATAIGFYNGFLEAHTQASENNDYSPEMYDWCARLSHEHLPLTQSLFLANYSNASFLWALYALNRLERNQEKTNTDIKRWMIEQPAQSDALLAYSIHKTHHRIKPLHSDSTVDDRIRKNAQLIESIYPDIPSVGQYVHVYTELFNQTPPNIEISLLLPASFDA